MLAIATRMCATLFVAIACASAFAQSAVSNELIEKGRHLIKIGHCNNCHTAGYTGANGNIPEERWLAGNPVGWRSKIGTTYAPNLRLFVQNLSESDWVRVMRGAEWRPPMPWWSVREHTDEELKAMYHYIRSLRPLGEPAPSFLPADQMPKPPYWQMPDLSLTAN